MILAKRVFLFVGHDRLAHQLLTELPKNPKNLIITLDTSSNARRVFRLLLNRVLSIRMLTAMAWAQWRRPKVTLTHNYSFIRSNHELRDHLRREAVDTVLLFRAGLIINKACLALEIDFLNVHCGELPQYGGIGSTYRALKNQHHHQRATLHHLTERIDDGQVVDTEPYLLSPSNSYKANEDLAYAAGIKLTLRTLRRLGAIP